MKEDDVVILRKRLHSLSIESDDDAVSVKSDTSGGMRHRKLRSIKSIDTPAEVVKLGKSRLIEEEIAEEGAVSYNQMFVS